MATISQLADPSLSIYIHKIFLPIILRCESQRPLSQLHTARTNIATISLVPIIAMLMGSIKSNQNQTVIKSFEKSLTAYMESCGDTREIMSCSTHLNDIIEHMLPEFVDEIVVKYEFINSHPTTRFNEENSDASDSVEDENQRHLQRSQQDLKLLLQQPLNLVELFLRVQHQGSSLPIEYIRSSEVIISAFTDLTRRLNSIPQVSDISEMKKLVHQLIKLIKSLSNYITSNNSKTD